MSMLTFLIILVLIYAFLNGYRDSASIVAGVIASRAMHPRLALSIAATAEFIAPFLFGEAVARTLATGLIDPAAISLETVVAAVVGALVWTLFAWWRGVPSSSSHALVGGLIGSGLFFGGAKAIQLSGLIKVILPLFLAPPLGLAAGYLVMNLLLGIFGSATPRVNTLFRRLQIFTMIGLAFSHSANDSGKAMGIIALGLGLVGWGRNFGMPLWVVAVCATAIAIGAIQGDWRLIRTLGGRIYQIRPLIALASQSASAGVVMGAAVIGAPVSTSQVISMALMGSGAAERANKVRWQIGVEMLATWALTIPATMTIAAIINWGMLQADFLRDIFAWFLSG